MRVGVWDWLWAWLAAGALFKVGAHFRNLFYAAVMRSRRTTARTGRHAVQRATPGRTSRSHLAPWIGGLSLTLTLTLTQP